MKETLNTNILINDSNQHRRPKRKAAEKAQDEIKQVLDWRENEKYTSIIQPKDREYIAAVNAQKKARSRNNYKGYTFDHNYNGNN